MKKLLKSHFCSYIAETDVNFFNFIKKSSRFVFMICCYGVLLTFMSSYSYGQTEDESLWNQQPVVKNCEIPSPLVNVVINYSNFAKVYLEFSKSDTELTISYREKGQANDGITVKTVNNKLLISNLSLGKEYVLSTSNSCGKTVDMVVISTVIKNSDEVNVSKGLFNAVADYTQNYKTVNAYEYLIGLNISYYEKVAFIQQYFNDGVPIDPTIKEGVYPPMIINNSERGGGGETKPDSVGCKCKFLIGHSQLASLGIKKPGNIIDNDIYTFSDLWESNGDASDKVWGIMAARGASKYQQMYSQGHRLHSRSKTWNTLNNGAGSPYFGRLGYQLFCISLLEVVPRECVCEKQVNLNYRYDTRLDVKANTTECWSCGSRGSGAHVEDLAALVVTTQTGSIDVLDARGALLERSCDIQYNNEFFIKLLDVAEVFAKTAISANLGSTVGTTVGGSVGGSAGGTVGGNAGSNAAWLGFITEIKDKIAAVIKTPFKIHHGTCGSDDLTSTLISGEKIITLKPNLPTYISLYSFSNMKVDGFTAWENNARILSDYSLLGILKGGYTSEKEPNCCTNRRADWIIGWQPGNPGSPRSDINLKDEINSAINLYPWPQVSFPNTEYGEMKATICPDKESDPLPVTGGTTEEHSQLLNAASTESGISVQQKGGEVYLSTSMSDESVEYSITDAVGRAIKKGFVQPHSNECILTKVGTPVTGIYFIRINDVKVKSQQSIKIFIQK